MNREILFRAKHMHVLPENEHLDGRWIEGYLVDKNYINSPELEGEFLIDESTICQYTGLTDKNGRKIWENDVVSGVAYSSVFVGYIVWIDEIAGFGVRYYNRHREPTAWENSSILKLIRMFSKPNKFQAEVIGNIFDNPDLIKD